MPEASPEHQAYLQAIGDSVKSQLPPDYAFLVIAAPLIDQDTRKTFYVSSITRPTAIKLLKEFLFRIGEDEDWMKHIT